MRIKSRGLVAAAVVLMVCTVSSQALAALVTVFSTDFNAPTYSDGVLNVGTDTTTAGQDGWLNTSGGGTNNITVQNTASNGFVNMTTSGQDVRHPFTAINPSSVASVYLDADISVSAAQATGDYFIHLGDGGTSNFYARTYIKSQGSGFAMALGTSSGTPVTYGAELPFNTPTHILVRYDFVPGLTNDTGALYINPTTADGSGDTPYVAATTIGTDPTSIAGAYLRQGSGANAATLASVDNIVVSVPEPASLGLLALGGLAFGRRRRA